MGDLTARGQNSFSVGIFLHPSQKEEKEDLDPFKTNYVSKGKSLTIN